MNTFEWMDEQQGGVDEGKEWIPFWGLNERRPRS